MIESIFHVNVRRVRFLFVLVCLTAVFGCAPVFFKKPLSDQELTKAVSLLKEQEERVSAFFCSGQMAVKDWYGDEQANVLTVGTRRPLRLRMEVTHAWGQPILYLLVRGETFKALSYGEKKLYVGDLTPGALSTFFPADLDAELIWDVLRGFPALRPTGHVESRQADRLSLLKANGDEIQVLELDETSRLPRRVLFPEWKTAVAYDGIERVDGILFAKEVRITPVEGTRQVTLKNGNMVFNKPIPDEIFRLESVPGFEIVYVEKSQGNSKRQGPN